MANTYLTRTNSGNGSETKGTYSAWIKRSGISGTQYLWHTSENSSNDIKILFNSGDVLRVLGVNNGSTIMNLTTNRLFRDTGAWYHVVVSFDTTQSTASNRVKIYINGVQETSFSTATYPGSSANIKINQSGDRRTIGTAYDNGGSVGNAYWNGSMSHVYWIDGTTYAASTFGSTDSTTGSWKINTSPSLTMGTNGFTILKDGKTITDQSANSNNFSLGGGTLTKTEDNPSNVFATMNPLDGASMAKNSTFSNGNNTVICSGSNYRPYGTTIGVNKGKWYAEFQANANMGDGIIGVFANYSAALALSRYANGYGWYNASGGNIKTADSNMSGGASVGTYATNNIVQIALDLENNKLHFNKNNSGWLNSGNPVNNTGGYAITDPASTSLGFYFMSAVDWGGGVRGNWDCNFGNGFFGTSAVSSNSGNGYSGTGSLGIFQYQPPTGYTALCTKGLNL